MTTTATRYALRADAVAAINAMPKTEYGVTHFAQGNRRDGVDYWLVVALDTPLVGKGRPVQSERFVYTPSGKKNTSRNLCKRAFKKFAGNRNDFVAYAVSLGVKPATARAMFSHYTVGRYSVNDAD